MSDDTTEPYSSVPLTVLLQLLFLTLGVDALDVLDYLEVLEARERS